MNEFGSSPKEAGQTPFEMQKALALVLTGVSGSGKSEVGRKVADRFGLKFLDADDFHSTANKDKMHRGVALADGTLSGRRLPLVREDCVRKDALSFYLRREYQ